MSEQRRPCKERFVRCPRCKRVYRQPANLAADVSGGVARFDWPRRICPECVELEARAAEEKAEHLARGGLT